MKLWYMLGLCLLWGSGLVTGYILRDSTPPNEHETVDP